MVMFPRQMGEEEILPIVVGQIEGQFGRSLPGLHVAGQEEVAGGEGGGVADAGAGGEDAFIGLNIIVNI